MKKIISIIRAGIGWQFLYIGGVILFIGAADLPPSSYPDISRKDVTELILSSADESLVEVFNWAVQTSQGYAGSDNDPVGPWYEAALPNRSAFCMRDLSHQCIGEQINGHGKHNLNMMTRFMENISESKDWCTYWEINKDNLPAPVDYTSDDDFWYNLNANFDVLDACYRLYLWTGDETYISDPRFERFRELSLNEYVDRWQLQPDKIMQRPSQMNVKETQSANSRFRGRRGIPSYEESTRGIRVSADLIACIYRGFMSSSQVYKIKGNDVLAEKYANRAKSYLQLYDSIWWNDQVQYYYSIFMDNDTWMDDQKYTGNGHYVIWYGLVQKPERITAILERHSAVENHIIEIMSYCPMLYYRYGMHDAAYRTFTQIFSNNRRDYPEASSGVIEGMVSGLIGIQPNAAENVIATLPRLTETTTWVAIENVPTFVGAVSVLHESNSKSAFANKSDKEVLWRATFSGKSEFIQHRGKNLTAQHFTDAIGNEFSYTDIVSAPGSLEYAEVLP